MMRNITIFLGFCAIVSCAGGSVTMNQYNELLADYDRAVKVNNENVALYSKYSAECEEMYGVLQKCINTLEVVTDTCDCHQPTKEERTQGL